MNANGLRQSYPFGSIIEQVSNLPNKIVSPWKDLFDHYKCIHKGLGFEFIKPSVQGGICITSVNAEEVSTSSNVWSRALAFYVIGASGLCYLFYII